MKMREDCEHRHRPDLLGMRNRLRIRKKEREDPSDSKDERPSAFAAGHKIQFVIPVSLFAVEDPYSERLGMALCMTVRQALLSCVPPFA